MNIQITFKHVCMCDVVGLYFVLNTNRHDVHTLVHGSVDNSAITVTFCKNLILTAASKLIDNLSSLVVTC